MSHLSSFRYSRIGIRLWLSLALLLAVTAGIAKATPSNLHVTGISATTISLAWTVGSGTPYTISYFAPPQSEEVFVGKTSGSSFTVSGLRPDTDYALYVNYGDGTRWLRADARTLPGSADYSPDDPRATKTPPPVPPPSTCMFLSASIVVSGYGQFTQCQRVDAAGLGSAELAAQGFVDALNVWGIVDSPMQVCFRNQGSLKFLDTTTRPRAISGLASEVSAGMTCGTIDKLGTIVLLSAGDAMMEAETAEQPLSAATGPRSVSNCRLATTDLLSLRAGPGVLYARLAIIPYGASLNARARTSAWFLVNFAEQSGWVMGDYANASAGCDILGDAIDLVISRESDAAPSDMPAPQSDAESQETAMPAAEASPLTSCQLRTGDIVNLRQGPGLEYAVEAEIPYLFVLSATARSDGWYQVEYAGESGWVSADYVFASAGCSMVANAADQDMASPDETATAESQTAAMPSPEASPRTDCQLRAGDIINLRAGPGLDFAILAEIPYLTELAASERAGDWFKVDFDSQSGWVNIDYVFRRGACG